MLSMISFSFLPVNCSIAVRILSVELLTLITAVVQTEIGNPSSQEIC
jgi:hypothetical protein